MSRQILGYQGINGNNLETIFQSQAAFEAISSSRRFTALKSPILFEIK
jgi:hypothetical protein